MTKTSDQKAAALRFANENGYYSDTERRYVLFGHKDPQTQRALADDYAVALEKERKQHTADLKIMMALLGVEDQYEDTVETRETRDRGYFGLIVERDVVTKTAVQKFAEDLRAAQSAVEGEAALKRLRKAVKNVKKESDK